MVFVQGVVRSSRKTVSASVPRYFYGEDLSLSLIRPPRGGRKFMRRDGSLLRASPTDELYSSRLLILITVADCGIYFFLPVCVKIFVCIVDEEFRKTR